MDRVIIVFAVIGTLMFAAYMYFIIKTSYDDEKLKKKEKLEEVNRLEEAKRLEEEAKSQMNGKE
ncbi:MAG: hypothetical protein HOP31_13460 [Ignavibacteria bacterium]|nr:hypothetical protein [Ignavibacteria bacterium]